MKQIDLPQRWQENLRSYLADIGSKYNNLSASDFHHNLRIDFADGSNAYFLDALYIIDEDFKEFAVFTEHCGYHIFNLPEIKLELLDWQGNIVITENYRTE